MKKDSVLIFLGVLVLLIFSFLALTLGATRIAGIWNLITNPFSNTTDSGHKIIWEIRAPRIAMSLLVGAALGIAGVMAQGATNNALAEPSILGTAAGASIGVLIGILFNVAEIGSFSAVLFAAIGALAATILTFALAQTKRAISSMQLVIVGIATSAILSAIVGLLVTVTSRPEARSVSFWSLGSLALTNSTDFLHLLPIVLFVVAIAYFVAPSLDLLSLGDETTNYLGVSSKSIRLRAFIVLAILVAVSVSSVGTIAFLGLAAPHIARFIFGPAHRKLVISSALIGAFILLVADTAARTVAAPNELPIGLITSLIGAPVLISLVRTRGQVWK